MVDKRITAEAWAAILIEKWQKEIDRLNINDTGALRNSFEKAVAASSGGDLQKIELAYNFYGYFVDIGVGRGVKIGEGREKSQEAKLLGNRARSPKPWLSKILKQEAWKLAEIMKEKYGDEGMRAVLSATPGKISLS
jgi:hypothetical protein